jgi:hypothetical protein
MTLAVKVTDARLWVIQLVNINYPSFPSTSLSKREHGKPNIPPIF